MLEHLLKVVIIGDMNVGKTALLINYVDGSFSEKYQNTIGVDFRVKELARNDCIATMQLWDTAGQDRYKTSYKVCLRAMTFICVVQAVEQAVQSLTRAADWQDPLHIKYQSQVTTTSQPKKKSQGLICPHVVLVSLPAQEFADQHHMLYVETSAKTSANVHLVFDAMADRIIRMKTEYGTVNLADTEMSRSFRLESKDAQQADWCYGYGGYCY
ncbi:unnamed protein product [Lymnaea stagnalis]|uniref:Uncharacterized protein n=1 Tax=Lymnaea stagnalis TaxID=6523 RepID=A0AAV2HS90_LYMST